MAWFLRIWTIYLDNDDADISNLLPANDNEFSIMSTLDSTLYSSTTLEYLIRTLAVFIVPHIRQAANHHQNNDAKAFHTAAQEKVLHLVMNVDAGVIAHKFCACSKIPFRVRNTALSIQTAELIFNGPQASAHTSILVVFSGNLRHHVVQLTVKLAQIHHVR